MGAWRGEFWVVNPSKVLTAVLYEPHTPGTRLWDSSGATSNPCCGVLTDFWGTHVRKALLPCIPPQAKQDLQLLVPAPLWPHPVPSCPILSLLLPHPEEQILPDISRSSSFPAGLDEEIEKSGGNEDREMGECRGISSPVPQ